MQILKSLKTGLLVSVCVVSMTLSGCNEKAKEQMIADTEAFCNDFANMDFDAMYELTHDKNKYFNDIYVEGAEGSEAIFESMADNLQYEIGECEIKGKNAVVHAHISNIDMNVIMNNVLNEYFEQCEADPDNIDNISIDDIIYENANDPVAQRRNVDTVFNFIKQDGEWVIESNVMIYDDITGGYMSYYFQTNMMANSVVDEPQTQAQE